MTNKKSTKKALLLSVLSLLLCCSMLIGTTFAWFTDSVTSGNNRITAGNLDVELFHTNKVDTDEKVTSSTTLFDDVALWEPGAMVWEKLTVKNVGSLALKYTLNVNATNFSSVNNRTLADVLKVAVLDAVPTRDSIMNANLSPLSSFVLASNQALEDGDSDTFYIAIYWAPSDIDNYYNVAGEALYVDLGINLVATQYTSEEDSFDDQYDVVDIVVPGQSMTLTADEAPSLTKKETSVEVPADTFDDGDEVSITVSTTNSLFDVSAATSGVVASLDVVLSVNGEPQEQEIDGYYTVTTYISTGLSDVTVAYTGTDGRDQPIFVSYDAETGKLVFKTNHFSEYAVSAKAIAVNVAEDTAYATPAAVVEALKEENAEVTLVEDLTASDKVELKEAIDSATDLKSEIADADTVLAVEVIDTVDELVAAIANGGSILLGGDITIEDTILITKDTELDLNGYTLTCNVPSARALKVAADGVDFVLNADGATVNFGNNTYGVIDIADGLNGASVTVNNGTFEGTTDGGAFVKLRNGANHTVTLNNVTYTDNYALVPGMINAFLFDTYQKTVENYAVTINGGTYDLCAGTCINTNVKLVMNGVTMSSKGSAVEAGNAVITNCVINVNPGLYTGSIDASAVSVNNNGNVVVKGTEINSERYGLCVTGSGGTITAENCTIKAKDGNVNFADEEHEGKIILVGVPVAWVEELEEKNYLDQNGNPITLDCAYSFLPTQSKAECEESGYAKWHADFVISVDKDVANVGNAGLAGYYSAWCDDYNDGNWFALDMSGAKLVAGEELRLVAGMLNGTTVNYGEICEYAIRPENTHNGFLCGAYADESMSGVTLSVELRLYEIDETQSTQSTVDCETGNYYVIADYDYTFE